ncbi:uncharacterized protein LOC121796778 [Salvia splendens]|uniref:uncharacterized protein LOC121796778 n=1 Tax=Salvia splendens TaxID=180675 RepID=UPI001C253636|nr:uncharacterized protein LOC121796778 [Salvia splendens]
MVTKWQPPDPPWIKLNVKGSYIEATGRSGGGGIFRNHQGSLVSTLLTPMATKSELKAKLEMIYRGLSQARGLGHRSWVETSSRQATAMINKGEWGPANARQIMVKIRNLLAESNSRISTTHHDGNKAAALLAQLGIEATLVQTIAEDSAPMLLRAIIHLEQSSTPSYIFEFRG